MDINIETVLQSASVLRYNLAQALGTILQHQDTEQQLTWWQLVTIRWLHNSLTSGETNTMQLLPEAQKIFQSQTALTPEQEVSILSHLLSQSSCITFHWNKNTDILKSYSTGLMLKGLPENLKQIEPSELVHIVNLSKKTFLESIFKKIQHGYITLTSSLLVGLLNNIHLHCLLPETHELLRNVTGELFHMQNKLNSLLPKITVKPQGNLRNFLLETLNFLVSEQSPLQFSVKLQIYKIIPFFTPGVCKNVNPQLVEISHKHHKLFLAIRDDEFPCDVISARDILMSAISSGKLDITKYSDRFMPTFYGNDHLSILFAFLAQLSFLLPNAHPASAYVHTLLSYVKMKYIVSNGGTFVPTVQLDIAMLLNSFNTLGIDLSETNAEIYHAFQNEIQWKKILYNFPFYRYSQPRPLLVAMLHKILGSNEIKLCHRIILKYFIVKVQNPTHQCQNQQISEVNIFVNPTTQTISLKPPILSQPANVLNGTLSFGEVKLSAEPQIMKTITTSFYDSDGTFTNEITNKEHKVKMVIPSQNTLKPKFSLMHQCSTNANLDTAIKAEINDILLHAQKVRNGILITDTYLVCTNMNNDKVYIIVNDQTHMTTSSDVNTITSTPMPASAQELENSHSIDSCINSTDATVWVDVPSLMKAVDSEVTAAALQLAIENLTPDMIHGFDVTRHDTKGTLLYELLSFIIMNNNINPITMNVITHVKNNVHIDGPGAERPILICVNYPSEGTTLLPLATPETSPLLVQRTPITCIDNISKENGIKVIMIWIQPLLTAIAPNAPQHSKNIITEFLSSSDVSSMLKGLNLEEFHTRGQMLEGILTFLASQVNFQSPKIKEAIHIILPYIQVEGFGALHPEIDVMCSTSKFLTHSTKPFTYNHQISNMSQNTTAVLQSTTEEITETDSSTTHVTSTTQWIMESESVSEIQTNAATTESTSSNNSLASSQLFNVFPMGKETKNVMCTEQQIRVYVPNIKSLLKAVDDNVSHQSIALISNYFESKDIGQILQGFHTENYKTQGVMLTQLLSFIKIHLVHDQSQILTAIDEILPHIKFNRLNILKPEIEEVCMDLVTDKTITPATTSTMTHEHMRTQPTTPNNILQVAHTAAAMPVLQNSNLKYHDEDNNILQCPDHQIKRSIYNVTALLDVVDKSVSKDHISTVRNFLQGKDIIKLLQALNLEQIETKADILTELIISVKLTYPILEQNLSIALDDILNNIHFDDTGLLKPSLLWVCQDTDEIIPSSTYTILKNTTKHSERYATENKIKQTIHTTDISEITSSAKATSTDMTTQTTEPYTLPTIVQLVYEENVSNTIIHCADQHMAVFIPNIRNLLQAVYNRVSVKSLNLVTTFFERKDIVHILKGFYAEDFKTGAELLTNMLTFVKHTYLNLAPTILDAFNEVLLHIKFKELGALKPDFILVCQDTVGITSKNTEIHTPSLFTIETEHTKNERAILQTTEEKLDAILFPTSTSKDFPSITIQTHFTQNPPKTMTTQLDSTDIYSPSTILTQLRDPIITETITTKQTTSSLTTEITESVALAQVLSNFSVHDEREIHTLNCSSQEITVKIPNIKSLLNAVINSVSIQNIQLVIKFFQQQDILHILKEFNFQENVTKADMLINVITFVNHTCENLKSDVHNVLKNIMSHITFDGQFVTQNDYIEMCQDIKSMTIYLPTLEPMSTEETKTAYSASTHSTIESTITQASEASLSSTDPADFVTTVSTTYSSEIPIPILCVDKHGGTKILSYNIVTLFDALDSSTPITEKNILFSYLTQPGTYNILAGLNESYPNNHDIQDITFNALTFTTYGSLLKGILLFLRNRADVHHHVLTAIDVILPHIQSDGLSALHFNATAACYTSNLHAVAESTPDLGKLGQVGSANNTRMTHTNNIYILEDSYYTQYTTKETSTEQLFTEASTPSTHLITEVFPLPTASTINIMETLTNASIHCADQQVAVAIPNIKTLLKAVKGTVSQQSLRTVISFFERHDISYILKGFYADEFKTRGVLLNKMLTFVKFTYQHLHPSVIDAFNDIISQTHYDGFGSLKPDLIIVCQDSEVPQHIISLPETTKLARTPKEGITESTEITIHETKFTQPEAPTTVNRAPAREPQDADVTTSWQTPETHAETETTESLTRPELHNIQFSRKQKDNIIFCTEQKAVSIPNITTLLQAVDAAVSQEHVNIVLSFFSRKDIVHVVKGFNAEDFTTRGELLTNLIRFVEKKYSKLENSHLYAFNQIISHISSDGDETVKPDFIKVCEDVNTLTENNSAVFDSTERELLKTAENSDTTSLSTIVGNGFSVPSKHISESSITANKPNNMHTEEIISPLFSDLTTPTYTGAIKTSLPIKPTSKTTAESTDFTETTQMAAQTNKSAAETTKTTESYLFVSTLPNTSEDKLHLQNETYQYLVANNINLTVHSDAFEVQNITGVEADMPVTLPNEETSETEEPTEAEIIVPEECLDEESTQMLAIDIPSLMQALDSSTSEKLKETIIQTIDTAEIQNELKILDWDKYHSKGAFLKDILLYLISNSNKTWHIKDTMAEVLLHVKINGSGASLPVFKFICVSIDQFPTESPIPTVEPVIKIHTLEQCAQNILSNATTILSISSILKAVQPAVPRLAKAVVTALFHRDEFSSLLIDFNIKEYKTNGQLLKALLSHLRTKMTLEANVLESIQTMLNFISFDGLGALSPDMKVVCDDVSAASFTEKTIPESDITTSKISKIPENTKFHTVNDEFYKKPEEPENEKIEITNKCFDNGTMQILTVDVSPLVHIIDRPITTLLQIKDVLREPSTQEKLKIFNWDAYHDTKGKLLKDIINFLINTVSYKQQEYSLLDTVIPFINMNYKGAKAPAFIFSCTTEEPTENDTIKNEIKLEEITGGPAIVKPSRGQCNNKATPILVVNIHTLFTTLKPTTPHLPKAIVTAYVTKPCFYKKISNFSLANFKTRGEQLQELLVYLVTEVSGDTTLMKAIDKLLQNVRLDGPGKLPTSIKVICNTTLNKLTGIPLPNVKDIIITEPPTIEQTRPTSVLTLCIQSLSGTTYEIDFLTTFSALKPNAPQVSLTKIVSFLTKPNSYTVLKNFNVTVHKTRGDLLASFLLFLEKKLDYQQDMIKAIREILPFVIYDGPGSLSPNMVPNCTLPDKKKVILDKPHPIIKSHILPQGPKLIDMQGNECMSLSPDSSYIQGTTTYKVDVPSLTKLLNGTAVEAMAKLFVSEYLQNYLHILNLKEYSSRAELLKGMLSTLENYPHLDNKKLLLVKKMKSHIQSEGEGALPPLISALCTKGLAKSNPQYIMYETNETCFMPRQYSKRGMPYELQTESLLQTIKPEAPKKMAHSVISFLKQVNVQMYLQGFNILVHKTQGEMMRDLLLFLAMKPEIKLEYKKAMSAVIPYIHKDGPGALASVIITTCPKSQDEEVTNKIPVISMEETTENISTQNTTILDTCASSSSAIITTKFDASIFQALDNSSPNTTVAIISNYLNREDTMPIKLHKFYIKKYKTKGDLLQALLAFIWTDEDSHEDIKDAAKTLLPHVIFHGPAQQSPNLKTHCYIPEGSLEPTTGSDSLHPSTLVYPSDKTCVTNVTHTPGIIIYRIDIPSLFKALKPDIQREFYLSVAVFLNKPYAYKYIHGINMEKYNTQGELLRAILTVLRFTQRQLERNVKKTLNNMLYSIHMYGARKLPIEKQTECSALLMEDKLHTIDLKELLKTIAHHKLRTEISEALNVITEFTTSSRFNLTEYLPWLDSEQPITQGELLKLILLQILDKNPSIRQHAILLLPYIQEEEGVGKKVVKIGTEQKAKPSFAYETDFLQLLHVLKPEAPKKSVAAISNLFGKQDMYKNLEGFNLDTYQTQGELLVGILTHLKGIYDENTELGRNILQLIPFVNHENTGSLPPIIKKIYITTNASVNVFILDLGTLYKVIPRNNLTKEGKQALDTIFKYLSRNETDYLELLQSISSQLSPKIQLKLILNKLKELADSSLESYIDILLVYLEEQLAHDSYQDAEHIPEMDWIAVLQAIPHVGVPVEIITGKKDLYRFLLSETFKNAVHNFHISLSLNRAKFLKVLLAYLRSKSEVTRTEAIKNAIAYVYMFIKDEGAGLMSVQDDILLPEQWEEARNAQNHIKELLYQVLDLTQQEGASEILQTLQSLFDSTKLHLETTYIGYNVIEEFPPKDRLIIILRRIYHNFIMFLDQDTISAIDMVFISLGETKEHTPQLLHFLPINLEELLKTVLGPDIPILVSEAAETIRSYVNLKTVPLGKAFQDTVPSILNLNPSNRLAVVLRILWRTYSRHHDSKLLDAIKTVYEHIQPQKRGTEIQSKDHHMAIITALTSLVQTNAPSNVQDAKQVVIDHLAAEQNVYDKALASLVTKNLSSKALVARALRRFREHQYQMKPKLWISVSTIFEYFNVSEHDSTEDETDDSFDLVDEFKYLTDEAGSEVAPAKRILMKFMTDRKEEMLKIFHGQRVLSQFAPKEKMAILLRRLLHIYGENLEPEIADAAANILNHLKASIATEEDEGKIDIFQLLDAVIDQSSPDHVIAAKNLVKTTLLQNPSMIPHIFNGIVIQEDFNQHRQITIILRRIYRKFKLELNKEMMQSLIILFDHLEIPRDTSAEDQFVGNVTIELIFQKVFPKEKIPDEVAEALRTVLELFSSEKIDVKQILHGVHLWKLPTETQVSLILYRLKKNADLDHAGKEAVNTLLKSLDADMSELTTEDVDESYTAEKLFNEALANKHLPAEVQEAKGIIIHFLLSGSYKVKDVYRGTDFSTIASATERLVIILKNMYLKREILGTKMTEALQIMSGFLHVNLGDQEIDPHTFDFGGVFNRAVPAIAPQSVKRAKNLLLRAIKKRPVTFKRILGHISVEKYQNDNETVYKILKAIAEYKHHLSVRLRMATEMILKFLRGVPIDGKHQSVLRENESSGENETGSDTVGSSMFGDETLPKINKKG